MIICHAEALSAEIYGERASAFIHSIGEGLPANKNPLLWVWNFDQNEGGALSCSARRSHGVLYGCNKLRSSFNLEANSSFSFLPLRA